MENINWTGLLLILAFLMIVLALIGFSNYEKKMKRVEIKKVLVPPQEHLDFLVNNYGYDLDLAEQMWRVIREPGGDAGFITIQIYARKLYVEWYLKLSKADQAKYEWDKRGADLIKEIESYPEYWRHLPNLSSFIRTVRAYTG